MNKYKLLLLKGLLLVLAVDDVFAETSSVDQLAVLTLPGENFKLFDFAPHFGTGSDMQAPSLQSQNLSATNLELLSNGLKTGYVIVDFATQSGNSGLESMVTVYQDGKELFGQKFGIMKNQHGTIIPVSMQSQFSGLGIAYQLGNAKPVDTGVQDHSKFILISSANGGASQALSSTVLAKGETVQELSFLYDFHVEGKKFTTDPVGLDADLLKSINEKLAFGADVTIDSSVTKTEKGYEPLIRATAEGAALFTWPEQGEQAHLLKAKVMGTDFDMATQATLSGQKNGIKTSNMHQMKVLESNSQLTLHASMNTKLTGPLAGGHSSGSSNKSKGGRSVTGAEAIIKANIFDGSSAVAAALKKDMYIASDWNSDILPALKSISYPEKDIAAVAKALGVSYTSGSQSSGSSSSGSSKSSGVPSGLLSLIVKGNQQATINALRSGSSRYSTAQIRSALSKAGFSGGQINYIMSQVS